MYFNQTPEWDQLLQYLRTVASEDEIAKGIALCEQNCVKECSKSGTTVNGIVGHNSDASALPVTLQIVSARRITPSCSCGAGQPSAWCEHSVALLLRSNELGFLNADYGFPKDYGFRVSAFSGNDIANAIKGSFEPVNPLPTGKSHAAVRIALNLKTDRLGVQVCFDGTIQEPAIFQKRTILSARELDNLLLNILEEHGSWDEECSCWYVNSSRGIGVVLGLLQEFEQVVSFEDGQPITIVEQALDAELCINWLDTGADLALNWRLPDGTTRPKTSDLLGGGPFWTVIEHAIYPINPVAGQLASLFMTTSSLTLQRSQIGPLLEVLESGFYDRRLIKVANPKLQPQSQVAAPTPLLDLKLKEAGAEHFTSSHQTEITAALEFEYPVPPPNRNIVYLPHREREKDCRDFLISKGFEYQPEQRRYHLTENAALDLIQAGAGIFPIEWRVSGFEQIRRKLRFADVVIHIQLVAVNEDGEPLSFQAGKDQEIEDYFARAEWFDCQAFLTLNNSRVPISTLFKSGAVDSDRYFRLDNGSYARVPGGNLLQTKAILGMLDSNFKLSNTIKARLSTAQAMSLSRISDSQIVIELDRQLQQLFDKLEEFEGIKRVKISRNFKGKLRTYQADGVAWLNFLRQFHFGGILADEMGLGKTVQTLAFLQLIKERNKKKQSRPSLVVAPTSVVTNWWFEARRFAPDLKVLLLHGAERKSFFSSLNEYDLVITSYALLRLDRYELQRINFNYIILDEAQYIKNHQAATTLAAKSLRAAHRLALTGTPTENRPTELWSILDFLMPAYLGSYEFFRTYFEKPILDGGPATEVVNLLRNKTKPFMLRRTKAEVEKELPPKIESVLHVEMEDSQRDLYNQIVNEVRPKVMAAVQEKGVAGASISILAALLRLRQVCNHPNSIESLKTIAGYESGKFNLWRDLLDEALSQQRKILVFCQFKEMLNIMRQHLEHSGVNYLYLDGSTRDRQTLIDRFNQDDKVRLFLISLKAGGFGLNLTAADMVVLYDPWWNPAVENQAVDRAHRIGQNKTVHVYRLVTIDSVEQKIMDLKKKKNAIINALVSDSGLSTLSLTRADVEHLLRPVHDFTESTEAYDQS